MSQIQQLIEIMAALRAPETGCPWDREQTFASIAPYTLEEAYEVQDAIQKQDYDGLKDELGDLLFQVVYHARMAEEAELFKFEDVVSSISDKLIRRHPHVFADEKIETAEEQALAWEKIKQQEAAESDKTRHGLLDEISIAMPALKQASKIQSKAATVGFDWQTLEPVFEKILEELDEVSAEIDKENNRTALSAELGDLLFACVNLCRKLDIDAEFALGLSNQKFRNRFRYIENKLDMNNETFPDKSLEELDAIWDEAKQDNL